MNLTSGLESFEEDLLRECESYHDLGNTSLWCDFAKSTKDCHLEEELNTDRDNEF